MEEKRRFYTCYARSVRLIITVVRRQFETGSPLHDYGSVSSHGSHMTLLCLAFGAEDSNEQLFFVI